MNFTEWLDKKILEFKRFSDMMPGISLDEENEKRGVLSVIHQLEQLKNLYKIYEKECFEKRSEEII